MIILWGHAMGIRDKTCPHSHDQHNEIQLHRWIHQKLKEGGLLFRWHAVVDIDGDDDDDIGFLSREANGSDDRADGLLRNECGRT